MKIEILGTGCPKCKKLLKNVEQAVAELGVTADIAKVEDLAEITSRGVMMTLALVIDGEIEVVGKVSTTKDIKAILEGGPL